MATFSLVDGFRRLKHNGAEIKISHPHEGVTLDEYDTFLIDGEWPPNADLIRLIAGREDAIGIADDHGAYKIFRIYKGVPRHA